MNPYHLLLVTENLEGIHMNNTNFLVYVDCHEIRLKRGNCFVNLAYVKQNVKDFYTWLSLHSYLIF